MKKQREFFYPHLANEAPRRAPPHVVDSFTSYRDAVMWCWANRRNTGLGDKTDQAIFARAYGMHSPHMSRCVNPDTKAPMDLPPDLKTQFEVFTGWLAVSQWQYKRDDVTPMEWLIEDRKTA